VGGIYYNTACDWLQSSIVGTDIIGNNAYAGGGIHANHGRLNLESTKVKGNYALYGGGIYYGDGMVHEDMGTEVSGNWIMNLGFRDF
jgi:hypothetical protein